MWFSGATSTAKKQNKNKVGSFAMPSGCSFTFVITQDVFLLALYTYILHDQKLLIFLPLYFLYYTDHLETGNITGSFYFWENLSHKSHTQDKKKKSLSPQRNICLCELKQWHLPLLTFTSCGCIFSQGLERSLISYVSHCAEGWYTTGQERN